MVENEPDLNVDMIKMTKDTLDVQFSGDTAAVFMEEFIKFFNSFGGENFVTFTITDESNAYALTIENLRGKKSPADRIKELETKVHQLESELKKIRETPIGGETKKKTGSFFNEDEDSQFFTEKPYYRQDSSMGGK
jgi:hypothetical protein